MMYVSLDEAKSQVELDHDESDILVSGYIGAASAAVKNYLKTTSPYELERDEHDNPIEDSNGDPVYAVDSNGDFTVRPEVKQAVLILLAIFFRNRDENADNIFDAGNLPAPVTSLLYPLRVPTYA